MFLGHLTYVVSFFHLTKQQNPYIRNVHAKKERKNWYTLFLMNLARCANFKVLNVSNEQLQNPT